MNDNKQSAQKSSEKTAQSQPSPKSTKLFAKLPIAVRERMGELTPVELMVWVYYLLRAGRNGVAFVSRETMCRDLGLYRDTISTARASLVKKGWLRKKGLIRRADGTLIGRIEKFEAVVPDHGPMKAKSRRRFLSAPMTGFCLHRRRMNLRRVMKERKKEWATRQKPSRHPGLPKPSNFFLARENLRRKTLRVAYCRRSSPYR